MGADLFSYPTQRRNHWLAARAHATMTPFDAMCAAIASDNRPVRYMTIAYAAPASVAMARRWCMGPISAEDTRNASNVNCPGDTLAKFREISTRWR